MSCCVLQNTEFLHVVIVCSQLCHRVELTGKYMRMKLKVQTTQDTNTMDRRLSLMNSGKTLFFWKKELSLTQQSRNPVSRIKGF